MLQTGICSVTFRDLLPGEIVKLTAKAKLDGIEWGGDVHAPPDAGRNVLEGIRKITEDAGLAVSSYGSYHNVMKDENHPGSFRPVLDAAQALGTKVIRIWSGGGDSDKADDSLFEQAADRTRELADMAAARDMTLAFEFHRGGLTDTAPTAIRLLRMIDRPNVKTYYQVYDRGGAITPQEELRQILPHLQNVHCHHIVDGKRRLVEEGRELWAGLMTVLKENDHDGFVLIEFTLDNTPDNFRRDAATLRETIGQQ